MFSLAVSSGSEVNACGMTPITWRTPSASFETSWPAMRAVPEVGGVSVVIMRIRVVLPAPFGPSKSEDFALGDIEADVVDGNEIAKLFYEMVDFNRIDSHDGPRLKAGPAS